MQRIQSSCVAAAVAAVRMRERRKTGRWLLMKRSAERRVTTADGERRKKMEEATSCFY